MPKVEIKETINTSNKVFFPGEAHVSDADAKAIKEARPLQPDPQAAKSKPAAKDKEK